MTTPERRLPPAVHVAGTNGKGSTIAFMRAILEAAGQRVHVYTSPHLVRFHERVRLGRVGGGRFVDEERLVEALRRCEAANGSEPITVFEITTAAALLLFAETPADALLLEVGLGGRADATNVIERPAAAVVTPIGFDHAEHLGRTLGAVAGEKAGIFKRGCPAVIAPQDYGEADAVLRARAEAAGAAPVVIGTQDFAVARGERPPRLPGRARAARPSPPAPLRPPPDRQCGHGGRRPSRRRRLGNRVGRLRGRDASAPIGPGAFSA